MGVDTAARPLPAHPLEFGRRRRAIGAAENVDARGCSPNEGSDVRRDAMRHQSFQFLAQRVLADVVLDVKLLARQPCRSFYCSARSRIQVKFRDFGWKMLLAGTAAQ